MHNESESAEFLTNRGRVIVRVDGYLVVHARCLIACMLHVVQSARCKLAIGVIGTNTKTSKQCAVATSGPFRQSRCEVSEMQDANECQQAPSKA
jgi:hypothetical protein